MSSADTLVLAGSLGAVGYAMADEPDYPASERGPIARAPKAADTPERELPSCSAPIAKVTESPSLPF